LNPAGITIHPAQKAGFFIFNPEYHERSELIMPGLQKSCGCIKSIIPVHLPLNPPLCFAEATQKRRGGLTDLQNVANLSLIESM